MVAEEQAVPLNKQSSWDVDDKAGETQDSEVKHHRPRRKALGQQQQQQHGISVMPNKAKFPFQKRFLYILFLIVALWMIEQSTDARVFVIFRHHEPSLRIFRSLFEIFLLLSCTAASIHIYTKYLGVSQTERLLFYKPFSQNENEMELSVTGGSAAMFLRHDEDEIIDFVGDVHDTTSYEPDTENQLQNQGSKDLLRRPDETIGSIPSALDLWGSALDLMVWILITVVFYTVAAIGGADESLDASSYWALFSSLAAPTFPLVLFIFVAFKAFYPLRNRMVLLKIISFTIQAPWYEVSFRDGMVGDILTSMVRPMQDIAFTVCYLLFGLNQWWSQGVSLSSENTITSNFVDAADANVPAMEKSWLLHTLILPACAVSPLWYRFLQNMRQIHDQKRRWPYIGNAAKYFVAAQVAMFGVYHPEVKDNPIWLLSFVCATLYQIWWDLVMDWGMFERGIDGSWMLRSKRLYPSTRFYWALIVINAILRFCWTLSFIPLRYLSDTGVLTESFSYEGWSTILGPLIASAEILRRSLWGLIRVEWEIVKDGVDEGGNRQEMEPMEIGVSSSRRSTAFFADMSTISRSQLVGELSIYTASFAVLGLLIAAHRETL